MRYGLAMGEGGRGASVSRSLGLMRRVARWKPRSYVQIWAMAASGYVACAVIFTAALGWPRSGGLAFVGAAGGFIGGAAGQSVRLHRRRTG
jgi:hypothetical protein